MTVLRAGAATDTGLVRATNQDNLLLASPLFAVADGMGGHAAGEVASETAVEALQAAWDGAAGHDADALAEAAREANRRVWEAAQADPDLHGMGTTLVAVALVGAGGDGGAEEELAVVHVGDSRVYRLRQGELEQLTEDHSLVAELVAEGQLAADEAEFHPQRHVLTRALGVDPEVPVDLLTVDPRRGDRLLLCSDGLIREVSDGQVASILRRLADPSEAARELVREARMRGGSDNITVVVLDVTDEAEVAASGAAPVAGGLDATGTGIGDTTAVPVVAAAPPAAAPPAPDPEPDQGRRRRRAPGPGAPRPRLVTVRVVVFLVLLLAVLAAGAVGVGLYARGSYFVGVARDGQLTIYQGRPGGLLWFEPTVAARTGVLESQVEARHRQELAAGVGEPSVAAGRAYVAALVAEEQAAQRAVAP